MASQDIADNFKRIERSAQMRPLAEFLQSAEVRHKSHLSREQRLRIVEQALVLLDMNYVHLPLKQAMHAINPIQRLKLLKYRLDTKRSELEPVMQFHDRVLEIFASLRDVHTSYFLPTPFADKIAFLPFLIEQYFESDGKGGRIERFLVSRVMDWMLEKNSVAGSSGMFFAPGVEALYWNGVPIRRAIELNGEKQAGSNPEARLARGIDNLTVRPLDSSLPPDEKWVELTYRTKVGEEPFSHRFVWWVYDSTKATAPPPPAAEKRGAIDVKKTKINRFKKMFFPSSHPHPVKVQQAFKDNFYHETRTVAGRDYGYIRLFSFEVKDKREVIDQFVDEIRRIITADNFPQNGLIIDARGNPGGTIRAGERLLQLFTPRRIKPETFEFINTTLNLDICRRAPKGKDLHRWADSIAESVQTGATYSMGFPLQPESWCNEIGQVYYGPVVLITDALSYSTTDIFAAGFQDHKIGDILGTSDNTGAGGANMWTYLELMEAVGGKARTQFKPLPRDTTFRLAMRRSLRVGENEGRPLEELGIKPDFRHHMTRKDLMHRNADLVRRAVKLLNAKPLYQLSVRPIPRRRALRVSASSEVPTREHRRRIHRVDVFLNDRPHKSLDARNGSLPPTTITLGRFRQAHWLVQAFDYDNNLVAVARGPH